MFNQNSQELQPLRQNAIQAFTLRMRHLIYLLILIVVLSGMLIIWRCHRIAIVYDYLANDSAGPFEFVRSTELPDYITSLMGSWYIEGFSYGLSGVKEVAVEEFPDDDMLLILRLNLNCRKYHLTSTVISPQIAKLLANSSSLEELIIEYEASTLVGGPLDGELSRETIGQLIQSKSIVSLEIRYAYLPDDILQLCANMKQLRRLDLTGSEFMPADFGVLANLPHLEELAFGDGEGFTDEDLRTIGQLQHLKRLSIAGTRFFSEEAIEKFREQHPNCQLDADNILDDPW